MHFPIFQRGSQETVDTMLDHFGVGRQMAIYPRDTEGAILEELQGALATVEQVIAQRGDEYITLLLHEETRKARVIQFLDGGPLDLGKGKQLLRGFPTPKTQPDLASVALHHLPQCR